MIDDSVISKMELIENNDKNSQYYIELQMEDK